MATPDIPPKDENVYFNDPESGAEMARLLTQDRLITRGMGGLFSERSDLSGIHRILDVACGPGGWALEVAFSYAEREVVGLDVSRAMIDYSVGTEAHEGFRRDAAVVFKLFQPFIVRMGVATQEEVDQLYDRMQMEMLREDFRGLMLPLTAWGEKP